MNAHEQAILSYVLNACWQAPLMLLLCMGLCWSWPGATAQARNWLWLAGSALPAVLPAGGLLALYRGGAVSAAGDPLPALASRVLIAACTALMLSRAVRLLLAGWESRLLRRQSQLFRTTGGVEVRLSPRHLEPAGPLLIGLWHPAILIPRFLTEPEHARLLHAVIAHEMAHVRRGDMFALVCSELLFLPLAFHPVTRWLRSKLGEAREMACDEYVTRHGFSSVEYARCLVEVARNVLPSTTPDCALSIGNGGSLERRIRALLETAAPASKGLSGWQVACAIMSFLLVCDVLMIPAQYVYLRISAAPLVREIAQLMPHVQPPPPPPPPRPRM